MATIQITHFDQLGIICNDYSERLLGGLLGATTRRNTELLVHNHKYVQMMETVKQSGPWSSLGSHEYYVFTLVIVCLLWWWNRE